MKRLRSILAITSVRLSIAYTLIFGILAVVIVLYMTNSTAGILRKQIAESVNNELIQLNRYYDRAGINGLVLRLERLATAPGANLYVVADPAGHIIAGNVREIDTGVIDRLGWTQRPFDYTRFGHSGDREFQAVARIVELPNGMRLLVGRDLGEPERFRKVVGRALILSLGAMLVLGILTWFLIGRRALKRVEMVSRSTSRIMAGDRDERLPISGSGDEFDKLSTGLNSMLDRISLLDQGLRNVSDNIAHDLKTPLTRLRNKADAVLRSKGKVGAYRKTLEEMIEDSDQIIKTFDALLMISRVESGSVAAEMTTQDISAIVSDVVEFYEPVAEENGISLRTEIEPGITLKGNRELLSQALSNLLDNAFKYGQPESGSARISISLERQGTSIRICVADNGPGIPVEDRSRVTERFTRLELSRNKPGNGLGLSLVRAVALQHSGMLEFADNEPGLRACLVLPTGDDVKP
ncbi:MAG: HAMP domain-containing sensor histidine kinase [Pseudomonadota bacterium]